MKKEEWLEIIEDAFKYTNVELTAKNKELLFLNKNEIKIEDNRDFIDLVYETFYSYIFKKVEKKELICNDINNLKFNGITLEKVYQLDEGPFIQFARTYWSFRNELNKTDFFDEERQLVFYQILNKIELDLAGVFFPTPGPSKVPQVIRHKAMKMVLQNYTNNFDIYKFLEETPYLKNSKHGKLRLFFKISIILIILWIIFDFIF